MPSLSRRAAKGAPTMEDHLELSFALIDRIYSAAVEPPLWNRFVSDLGEALGGAAVALGIRMPQEEPPVRLYRAGFDEGLDSVLFDHLRRGLPWGTVFTEERFLQAFAPSNDRFPDAYVADTEFYRDYMEPQDIVPEAPVLHFVADEGGSLVAGVVIARKQGRRRSHAADDQLLELLRPHLRRALRVHRSLSGFEQSRRALKEVIDRMPIGVIVLDAGRQPLVTNRSADRIIGLGDGFRIDAGGPRAQGKRDDEALHKLVSSATAPEPGKELSAGGFMAISRPSGLRPYPVMISPLLESAGGPTNAAVAVLFISDPVWRQISPAEVLQTLYSLTHAEAELVQLLARGYSLDEAAEARGVTMNTARSHLKHIFAKTETKGQGELVQMVLTGVASISEE